MALAFALPCVGAGAAQAGGGGIDIPPAPELSDVLCVEACGGVRVAAAGSRVELSGRKLSAVDTVSFPARDGGRIKVPARNVAARRLQARVPERARTGRPRVRDPYGAADTSPRELKVVDPERLPAPGEFKLASAQASPRTAFFDARTRPKVTYAFEGAEPTDVRVDVIDRDTRAVVASFQQANREPFARHVARWDGRLESGSVASSGRYRFRVGPISGAAQTTDASRFALYGNKFPVRGPHSYGDGFGAGRNHQGQDVFAPCGTRLVAARGGRVKYRQSHSAAGHYVVIDARGTSKDYFYAHLARRARVAPGERVRTGQGIGRVGATGNASGCHLHFELWRGPWQEGGRALPGVTRALRNWDSWS